MPLLPHDEFLREAKERLEGLIEQPLRETDVGSSRRAAREWDSLLLAGDMAFVLECKTATNTAALHHAIRRLKARVFQSPPQGIKKPIVPVLAVPFMGPTGRNLASDEDCSWLDLSGNANIRAPGLKVRIEGHANRFKQRGRPASAFAPVASRIARHLLTNPNEHLTQRLLASAIGMDEGYVSRVLRHLADQELVVKRDGLVQVPDPDLLLRAWLDEYDFGRHHLIAGHIPARDGAKLLHALAEALGDWPKAPPYAATGLAAAWSLGRFAGFRLASLYVRDASVVSALADLSFRLTERGANVWLLIPDDLGVFQGVSTQNGVHCVAPVQAYLDLHAHPERAREVAIEMKSEFLRFGHRP